MASQECLGSGIKTNIGVASGGAGSPDLHYLSKFGLGKGALVLTRATKMASSVPVMHGVTSYALSAYLALASEHLARNAPALYYAKASSCPPSENLRILENFWIVAPSYASLSRTYNSVSGMKLQS